MELRGARALVTGTTGGLGDAIARACASRGAKVIVTGRREQQVRALATDIGGEFVVTDLAAWLGVVRRAGSSH
jgi:short-subunit dehydrogenase